MSSSRNSFIATRAEASAAAQTTILDTDDGPLNNHSHGSGGGGGGSCSDGCVAWLNNVVGWPDTANGAGSRLLANGHTHKKNDRDSNMTPSSSPSQEDHQEESRMSMSSILTQDMTQLSAQERNDILEQIHGVYSSSSNGNAKGGRTGAVEDDPEYIRKCIDQMNSIIKTMRDKGGSGSSGGSGGTSGGQQRDDQYDYPASSTSSSQQPHILDAFNKACFLAPTKYYNNHSFYLMFLRSTQYNPRSAVTKILQHFEFKAKLFGLNKVAKDITLDDLNEDDMIALQSGASMYIPNGDTSGRAICVTNMKYVIAKTWENQLRANWYSIMKLLQDETVQKRGVGKFS